MRIPGNSRNRVAPLIVPPATASVLGAGRSGVAAARLLLNRGYRVYLSDLRDNELLRNGCAPLENLGARVTLGGHDTRLLAESDFIVISPGIDERIDLLARDSLRDIPVFSEIELAYWFSPLPTVAVTGTNGKTTTVSLIGDMLEEAGIGCKVAGNIGHPFSRAVEEIMDELVLVIEISSFQLHRAKSFHPRIGMLLNLSPDHLERYRDVDEYYSAKFRLFDKMNGRDLAILNADDPEIAARARGKLDCPVVWFGLRDTEGCCAFVREQALWMLDESGEPRRIAGFSEIRLRGDHNLENILAASCAAASCGADTESISRAVRSFQGLPHRLETVARQGDVEWINDSKATTVDSVLRALQSFAGPLVLIMGGRHKGTSYASLGEEIKAKARLVIALGESAGIIEEDLSPFCRVDRVRSLEEAVRRADECAQPGETVLFSPGCSSFDMFTNYEERGDRFRELVEEFITVD